MPGNLYPDLEQPDTRENDDTARLDWLSKHLCYAMVKMPYMQSLPSRGYGWEGQELRDAIDRAMKVAP